MLKNKIMLVSIFIAITGISIIAFFAASRGEAQTQQNSNKREVKVRQVEKEKEKLFNPTSIQEGVMTEKQRKHSKIFKGYKDRAKLRDLIGQSGDVEVREEVGDVILPAEPLNLNEYLQTLSCKADAVILGTVTNKASQINDDGTFVFTDYEFTPDLILKNNILALITPNTNITVTRTGGSVKLRGHKISAIDYRQVPLVEGERYLLFLKFFPETGGYKSLGSSRDDDSFQIIGNRTIQQVSRTPLPLGGRSSTELSEFMTQVRTAVINSCENQGGAE